MRQYSYNPFLFGDFMEGNDRFCVWKKYLLMRLSHCRMMRTAQKMGSKSKRFIWTERKKNDILMLIVTLQDMLEKEGKV